MSARLTIRPAQMQALSEASVSHFERRLKRWLDSLFGSDLPDDEIREATSAAANLGIRRECDVACYCELLLRYTASLAMTNLDKDCRNILLAYGVPAGEKLRRLGERLESSARRIDA